MKSKRNIKVKNTKNVKIKTKSQKIKYKQKSQKYKQIIQDTVIYIQKYKTLDILTASDVNIYIQSLEKLFIELDNIDVLLNNNNISVDDLNRKFEHIKGQLSINFRTFGTKNITDLLEVIFDLLASTKTTAKESITKSPI